MEEEFGRKPRKQIKNDKETKPVSLIEYNFNLRGVDSFDQHASYNQIDIRSKYPYTRIVLDLLEVVVNNAYLIFIAHAN